MTPLAVLYEGGFYKVLWFNPATLSYEEVLRFDNYRAFLEYSVKYLRATTADIQTILSNINVLSEAIRRFAPTNVPEVFEDAFKNG